MKGYADGTFRPNQPMTREEVASYSTTLPMMAKQRSSLVL